MNTFYDSSGNAIAYIDDDETSIYLYDGTPVAWLADGSVYDYGGTYLGWMQDGWLYDRHGAPVFFTDESSGGPVRPARSARPARGARGVRPIRGIRELRPIKPLRSASWSDNSGSQFFG